MIMQSTTVAAREPIMASGQLRNVIRQLCQAIGKSEADDLTDRQLLERFAARHDEAAFAVLVRRHGPLVLGVCWRLLHDWHDAEDAFQATFLVLARKAAAVRWRDSVSNWLYEVAYRVATKARTDAGRRRGHERRAAKETRFLGKTGLLTPNRDAAWRELCGVPDEELHRLPERYRAPLLLCYLEGQTQDQAAHRLDWSLRTLKRGLERAGQLRRRRRPRRGWPLPAALIVAGLSQSGATAAVPAALAYPTVQAALRIAAGQALGSTVSAHAAAL